MPTSYFIRRLLLTLVLLTSPLLVFAQTKANLPPALGSAVKSLIAILSDNDTVASSPRLLRTVSLDDGAPDDYALVSFTLSYFDGGNEYFNYLAAFKRSNTPGSKTQRPRYRLIAAVPVGGKAWRSVDFNHLRYTDGRIEFDTKEYRDHEPFCCPSKPAKAVYLLDRLSLKEIKTD
ncbi:hypothetical protein [Herminiimonas arsenitoxidans]|uniref:hypothetical protein n=1 Tax=Herminiimonas arsenitoxidans TaxID=1809410 RepID=UPI000970E66D|nr:hypothetical protein [Herminiimonas arsenitoxidans]